MEAHDSDAPMYLMLAKVHSKPDNQKPAVHGLTGQERQQHQALHSAVHSPSRALQLRCIQVVAQQLQRKLPAVGHTLDLTCTRDGRSSFTSLQCHSKASATKQTSSSYSDEGMPT